MDRKELACVALLAAVSITLIFSIAPADVPLNDDIMYYESVYDYIETGDLNSDQPYTVSLILQVLYGSVFAAVFGLSHSTLMLSMMVAGVAVVVASYFMLRTRLDRKYSVLGACVLLANPIFYNLTHTFMTDVLALFFVVSSTTFVIRFLDAGRTRDLAVASLLAVAGFWVRQYVITILGALLLYLLLTKRKELLRPDVLGLVVLLPAVSVLGWAYWFYAVRDLSYVCPYPLTLGTHIIKNIAQLFIYAGYFLMPIGLAFVAARKRIAPLFGKMAGSKKLALLVVALLMLSFIVVRGYAGPDANPFDKSLAEPRGVGAYTISGDKAPLFPEVLWIPITALSLFTALVAFAVLLKGPRDSAFLTLLIIALAAQSLLFTAFYDRYYLFLIPLALLFLLPAVAKFKLDKRVLVAGLILTAAWGWYGTYDYLAWNEARWDAIDYLLDSGVAPEQIDGGLEYDARFLERCTERSSAVRWHGWGYSISDAYVISFSVLDGYAGVREFDYYGPLGNKLGTIYALRKEGIP